MGSKIEGSLPSKLIKNYCCTSCHSHFFIKDLALKGSKCPLLLHCGHSVCEGCLQQNFKLPRKAVVCQQCGFSSPLESVEQISKCFPLNIYTVGSIIVLQNARHENNRKLALLTSGVDNFNYAVKAPSGTNTKAEHLNKLCEECLMAAPWYCENCKSNYCELCWSKVHGSAKSLMKHIKVPICGIQNERNNLKKCPEHETQYLEFFCNGCSMTVCSHCVILQHQGEGHFPITLKEKNMEMLSKLNTAAEEVEKIKKRMAQTLEKVKLMQTSSESPNGKPFSQLESQIARNFSRIHGILQLEEDRLLRKLWEKTNERESVMKAVQVQLEDQLEYVEGLLREREVVVKKPQGSDLTDLYRQLTEVDKLPCYLISQKEDDKEPTITFDEKLIEQLQTSFCKIDLPSEEIFELRSSSNLPEDYSVELLDVSNPEEDLKNVPKSTQESSVSDIDSVSNCSSRDLGRELESPLTKASAQGKVFQENKKYSVRVTYIKTPGEFYVTLNSQRSLQQAIDKRASQFASSVSIIRGTVAKDELYLVKYNVDKKWYRARVVEFLPGKKKGIEELVHVYYIDYGNSETVPLTRLRPIPPDILQPPLAIKCKLFDCVPKNGVWCTESAKTMEKVLDNYSATMFVMKIHRDCLEVDLSVIYPGSIIGRDIVSVRDALFFLEFSSFVHGPRTYYKTNALKYLHQCLPSAGERFDVVVSHVNSPSDFYVQRAREDTSYLHKLSLDLQKYYEENLGSNFIYNPSIGMPCAALFSSDGKWYRAKIVDIPGKKMVTVSYVDFGNKETVLWSDIRKLKENFVKRPPVALNCTLAGIIPANVLWNPQAKAYLENLEMVGDCSMEVQSRTKGKLLKVSLYRLMNKKEICVNSLFVDMGYAVKNTASCRRMKGRGEDKEEDDEKAAEEFINAIEADRSAGEVDEDRVSSDGDDGPPRRGRYFEDRRKDKLSAKKLRELHEFEKKNLSSEDYSTEEIEEVDEYNNIFKVKIEVLSAESPSAIYVTFPTLNAEFNNLQAKLSEFYKDSPLPEEMEWTPDAVCAVFDSETCSWFRASVLSVLPDDKVKVFLKDIARTAIVPTSDLRKLDPSFTKYMTCAVKCHLADVAPPGDQWPSISCEFLITELENYQEIYMAKRGQIENKSLPVELWVKRVVPKGALEPTTKEWITLNRLLINQGLAVPSKQKIRHLSPASNDDSDSVKDSDINKETIAETVCDEKNGSKDSDLFVPSLSSQWSPPEPLKTCRFVGIPTYVDYNADIYLYDVEDGEKLKLIKDSLLEEYENSKPNPEDHFWSPGQLCIARYHLDNFWYRGSVLKTNEDLSYDVVFVDYGNVETCQAKDMRKRIKMHQFPILTHKCRLQGIAPVSEDGKWGVSEIDVLHSLVVDKKCEVTVTKPSPDPAEPYTVALKIIESDIDVGTYLFKQGVATIKDLKHFLTDDAYISDSEDSNLSSSHSSKLYVGTTTPFYIPLTVPEDCIGFFIRVTKVKSETEFFANIVENEYFSPDLGRLEKDFELLQTELAEECPSQPVVQKAVRGHPCCCFNFRKNEWVRAEIINVIKHENSVVVIFVDYGSKALYFKDSLRECKNEWLTLPKMALEFKLAEVQKCSNVPETVYMKALTDCLSKPQIFADIIRKEEEVLVVRLIRNGRLAYQDMLDVKLMEFV